MDEKIPIAVIGVGGHGQKHARSLKAVAEAELVGVFDTHRGAAERAVARTGARVFDSAEALADACDALSIVTPTRHHFEIASAMLLGGGSIS